MTIHGYLSALTVLVLATGAYGQNITFIGDGALKQPLGAWLSNEYTTQPISMKDALYPGFRCAKPKVPLVQLTVAKLLAIFQDKASKITCSDVVTAYIDRIKAFDKVTGLNAVQIIMPDALKIAKSKDKELADFKAGKTKTLAPLFCVPILAKDNYDTVGVPTTNGAQAMLDAFPLQDSTMIMNLKDAGAVILAKANLAEWARSGSKSMGSAFGTVRNPYDLNRVTAGSSGGTGAGMAAVLGLIGLGTQTGNSITGPSSHNSLVGIRPSIGATSRAGIAPLTLNRDVGGPMARTVADVAAALTAMTYYRDPRDPVTSLIPSEFKFGTDFSKFLDANFLAGKKVGYLTGQTKRPNATDAYVNPVTGLFGKGLKVIEALTGSTVIPVDALVLPISNATGAPEEAVWKAIYDTGDLVRSFPNPFNTTSGGNIQPAANGTNNNNVLITSTRVLANGTTETFTAYEASACTAGKFDMQAYLPGTKSKLQTPEAIYKSGLFHPFVNSSLYGGFFGNAATAPGLPDTKITYTPDTYLQDPRFLGATCHGCKDWNEDPCRLKLRAAVEYTLKKYDIVALVFPQWSNFPRMVGDETTPMTDNTGNISPLAGVPHLTQPIGYGNGTNARTQFNADTLLPAGLAWISAPWREDILIGAAYAFEQAVLTKPEYKALRRVDPPAFPECDGSTYLPSATINAS